MARKHVERNAAQILKYLETLLPILEPGGGVPDNPMNRKERGSWRPPVSVYVMRLWMANPDLGNINRILSEAARASDDVEIEGRAMWKILGDCLFDHTAIRAWKAEGGIAERRLWKLCLLFAQRLATEHDTKDAPYQIDLKIRPDDEPERQKTKQAQRLDTAYTDTVIVRRVESLEGEGLSREEAKKALAKDPENEWGYERIRWAIKQTNRRARALLAGEEAS